MREYEGNEDGENKECPDCGSRDVRILPDRDFSYYCGDCEAEWEFTPEPAEE